MSVIGILFEKRIVDDSGFPRTPDRQVELLGTRERYPRSVKTMIGADVEGLDLACTAIDSGPFAVSGPTVDEGDRI